MLGGFYIGFFWEVGPSLSNHQGEVYCPYYNIASPLPLFWLFFYDSFDSQTRYLFNYFASWVFAIGYYSSKLASFP